MAEMNERNNCADRALGERWQEEFCLLARRFGKRVTDHQAGRNQAAVMTFECDGAMRVITLPDVTVMDAPMEHHEIKHKRPTQGGKFGLECYRFHALMEVARVTKQEVFYTIHDHSLSGDRDTTENMAEHWFTANVRDLDGKWVEKSVADGWVNSEWTENVPIYYWPRHIFRPLLRHFPGDPSIYQRLFNTNKLTS